MASVAPEGEKYAADAPAEQKMLRGPQPDGGPLPDQIGWGYLPLLLVGPAGVGMCSLVCKLAAGLFRHSLRAHSVGSAAAAAPPLHSVLENFPLFVECVVF